MRDGALETHWRGRSEKTLVWVVFLVREKHLRHFLSIPAVALLATSIDLTRPGALSCYLVEVLAAHWLGNFRDETNRKYQLPQQEHKHDLRILSGFSVCR